MRVLARGHIRMQVGCDLSPLALYPVPLRYSSNLTHGIINRHVTPVLGVHDTFEASDRRLGENYLAKHRPCPM